MIGRRMYAGTAVLLASACATVQAPEQQIPVRGETSGRTCDSSSIQDFVGRQRSPEVEAQLLEASKAATVRWVPKGAAVTMDYRSDRVTAYLDPSERIESISCS